MNGKAHFWGHPGLHQFLTFIITKLFGLENIVIKSVNIFFTLMFFTSSYLISQSYLKNNFASLILTLIVASFSGQIVLSFQYFQDIPALGISLIGIYFYYQKKYLHSSLFLSCSCLMLESQIAFTISILFIEYLRSKKIKLLKYYFLPLLSLSTYFITHKLRTGILSSAPGAFNIYAENQLSLFRPLKDIIRGLKDNYSFFQIEGLILVASLVIYLILKKKNKLKSIELPIILIFTTFQFFIFFFFINEIPFERDFVIFRITSLLIIFYLFQYFNFKIRRILTLVLFCFFMIINLSNHRDNIEFEPKERLKVLKQIKKDLNSTDKNMVFYEEDPQQYFAYPYYGFTNKYSAITTKIEEVNIYIDYENLFCSVPQDIKCNDGQHMVNFSKEKLLTHGFKLYKKFGLKIRNGNTIGYKIYLKN
jgi:hypothetical protein